MTSGRVLREQTNHVEDSATQRDAACKQAAAGKEFERCEAPVVDARSLSGGSSDDVCPVAPSSAGGGGKARKQGKPSAAAAAGGRGMQEQDERPSAGDVATAAQLLAARAARLSALQPQQQADLSEGQQQPAGSLPSPISSEGGAGGQEEDGDGTGELSAQHSDEEQQRQSSDDDVMEDAAAAAEDDDDEDEEIEDASASSDDDQPQQQQRQRRVQDEAGRRRQRVAAAVGRRRMAACADDTLDAVLEADLGSSDGADEVDDPSSSSSSDEEAFTTGARARGGGSRAAAVATRGRRGQQQKQKQPAAAGQGRSRRAAAVAASHKLRGSPSSAEEPDDDDDDDEEEDDERGQQQRRPQRTTSARATRGAAAAGAAAPAARPRRAAAAAARVAAAAALADEQSKPAWASSQPEAGGSDSDLGSPDASDDDEDHVEDGHKADTPSSDDPMSVDDEDEPASGSGGGWRRRGSKRQGRGAAGGGGAQGGRQQPARALRRRGEVRYVDDDEDDEEEEASSSADEQEERGAGSEPASSFDEPQQLLSGSSQEDEEEDDDDDDEEQPPRLDAFRFDAQQKQQQQSKQPRGKGKAGSPGSDGGEADAAALAALLQAEEELAADVAPPSAFAPVFEAKLPRGEAIERVLALQYEEGGSHKNVLVKLAGAPYRAAIWLPWKVVEAKRGALLRAFVSRQADGDLDAEWAATHNINPLWYQVDRVIAHDKGPRGQGPTRFLVKWAGLEYSECTWEEEAEVARDGAGKAALARYKRWSRRPGSRAPPKRPRQELLEQGLLPAFKNGRALRSYQQESLAWMVNNYRGQIINSRWQPRNCILGDEMGLGKTAQSIAVIAWLKQFGGCARPCMVVAPLTTLGHWKREIQTWTDLNVVLYAGSADDRTIIRENEFYYAHDKTKSKAAGARFDVLLASYETILKDKGELKKIQYEALILDEAHRLKSRSSATRNALLELPVHWLLLLSGTPVQNNMKELQGLMSLLDEDAFGDAEQFAARYGSDTPSLDQIHALQEALAPLLLRRMKEDVEDLPEKEEVVIWVELTAEQRRYYRALYSQQIGALLGGGANKNLPGMRNLAMELRKLCCHPFLCNGLEDDMAARWAAAQAAGGGKASSKEVEALTRASGKMLLLHKLLPKLRAEGRQVLIFSQFKMMLDVLEDYLTAAGYPSERIDGDTKHADRQAAIDRFMRARSKTPGAGGGEADAAAAADESGGGSRGASPLQDAGGAAEDKEAPFVFLLSTRAGGQGITLTSADTVIIYDSDWNPQNDLQAMARCHRIGQVKDVTVYRLVSRNTYEQQLFECASRKYGLDEAILGFAGSGDNPENDAARIEQLLRLGAHAMMGGDEPAAAGAGGGAGADGEEKGMAAEGIDQILAGRSEKRQLGSRKGNTFSVAHFGDGGGELDPEQEAAAAAEAAAAEAAAAVGAKDAKAFWSELLPEAAANHAAAAEAAKQPEVLGPRRRRQVNYHEGLLARHRRSDSDDYSAGGEDEDEERGSGEDDGAGGSDNARKRALAELDGTDGGDKKAKKKKGGGFDAVRDPELGRELAPWRLAHADTVAQALLRYGVDRMDIIADKCQQSGVDRPRDEIAQMCRALEAMLREMAKVAPELQQAERDMRDAAKSAARSAQAAFAAAEAAGDMEAAAQTAAAAAAAAAASAKTGNNMSVEYVGGMRARLDAAGLAAKLPPACARALTSYDAVRKWGRNPAALQQGLEDHRRVHAAMAAAGLAVGSSAAAPTAAAAATTPSKAQSQQQQENGAPAAAAAAAAGGAGASPEAAKRVWVAPRVLLRGSKGLPLWWKRDDDDRLLRATYTHGFVGTGHGKLPATVDAILADPAFGFPAKVVLDPLAALPVDAAADEAALELARLERARLMEAGVDVISTTEWRKLRDAVLARLRRVRAALCDPDYREPLTPSKQVQLVPAASLRAGGGAAAAAAAGGVPAPVHHAATVQQRLNFQPDGTATFKGKRVVGGLPMFGVVAPAAAAGAAAAARAGDGSVFGAVSPSAAAGAAATARAAAAAGGGGGGSGGSRPAGALLLASGSPNALGAVMAVQQTLLAAAAQQQQQQQAARHKSQMQLLQLQQQMARQQQAQQQQQQASRQKSQLQLLQLQQQMARQQQAQQQQQKRPAPAAAAAGSAQLAAAQDASKKPRLSQPSPPARPPAQQQQKEVVELLSDTSSDLVLSDDAPEVQQQQQKPAKPRAPAAAAPAAAAASAPPPSHGLQVRRVHASNEPSQEQSVDEPEAGGGSAAATPATGSRQHMQQLLGGAGGGGSAEREQQQQRRPAADGGSEHPVYGSSPAKASGGSKRKEAKPAKQDDGKQRKMEEFFGAGRKKQQPPASS